MNCTHYLNTPFKYAPLILPLSTPFYLKIDYRQRAIPLGNWYIGIFGLYGHAAFSPPSSKIEKFCKLHVCIIAYFIGNGCLFEGSVRKRNKASSEVCCCVIKRRRHSVASNLTMPRPPLIYPLRLRYSRQCLEYLKPGCLVFCSRTIWEYTSPFTAAGLSI